MTDRSEFLAGAAQLLGPRGLSTDPELIEPWVSDWRGRYTGRALALASPESVDQVSTLVRLCTKHGVPIVPQGGNSGMSGGATPDAEGRELLLSLRRLDRIEQIDTSARHVTCQAGVVLEKLHEAVAALDLRFPLTLGGKGSATIGGLVSTNAGGSQVLRHGSMRSLVLGLEAVLADGSLYSALVPLKKDNRGFDIKQLLIGSEGTLGIITRATLRLVPAVSERSVIWAGLASLAAARSFLLHCEAAMSGALEGFEVLPQACLDTVLEYLPQARNPLGSAHAWHALVEVAADRHDADTLRERAEAMVAAAFDAGTIDDAVIAANEAQAEAFWQLRESIAPAERAHGPAVQHDLSVAVERMPEFVEAAAREVETAWPGVTVRAFGHLGDGNVHFHVRAPRGVDGPSWDRTDGRAISSQVHDLVTAWGGSFSAEHGIGKAKVDELARLGDPVALALLGKVKRALDPAGLLNPGKLVALAPRAA